VAVAGNCRTTGLDDLAALADVCERYHVWLHVDACHGGTLIFNSRLRAKHLTGIHRAHSVSLDPHKGLFTPYPSSYVLFRDRSVLAALSRHERTVARDGAWDLGLIMPFVGSRGFHSLATWMMLKHIGTRRLGALVEARHALIRYLERRIDELGLFVRLNDLDFYRFAFVLFPPTARALVSRLAVDQLPRAAATVSRHTSRLSDRLYREGFVCFDEHSLVDLGNRIGAGAGATLTVMACCPGNPLLTQEDLDRSVRYLAEAGRACVPDMLRELREGTSAASYSMSGPAGWSG
jgi:glutamate/tyrosine decarboxylase-like PLP-dependent enzyme